MRRGTMATAVVLAYDNASQVTHVIGKVTSGSSTITSCEVRYADKNFGPASSPVMPQVTLIGSIKRPRTSATKSGSLALVYSQQRQSAVHASELRRMPLARVARPYSLETPHFPPFDRETQ